MEGVYSCTANRGYGKILSVLSTVATHPQRQKIIDSILAGVPMRKIAASVTPRVSHVAIQRYRSKIVTPTLAGASELSKLLQSVGSGETPASEVTKERVTAAVLAADPYLARIAQHRKTIDEALIDARKDKDARGVAGLIGTDLKGLELDARLTNRLDNRPAGPDLTIQLMVGIPRHSPTVDVQCKAITGPPESD